MSFRNSGGAGSEGGQCTKKTHAKVPHIQHHQRHHHRHDGIPQSKPMVQNSNCFGKTKLRRHKNRSGKTSQTCDNQQIWLQKILVQWFFQVQTFYFQTFWWRLNCRNPNPPNPNLETFTESGRDLCCPKFGYTISYKFIGWTNSFRWEMVG